MDRIVPSEGIDVGSTPAGRTSYACGIVFGMDGKIDAFKRPESSERSEDGWIKSLDAVTRRSALTMAAIAGIVVPAPEAQAEGKYMPEAGWYDGLRTMREEAFRDKDGTTRLAMQYKEGNFFFIRGAKYNEQEFAKKYNVEGNALRGCELRVNTIPTDKPDLVSLAAVEAARAHPAQSTLSIPPYPLQVRPYNGMHGDKSEKSYVEDWDKAGIPVTRGVVEPGGIWYYDTLKANDYRLKGTETEGIYAVERELAAYVDAKLAGLIVEEKWALAKQYDPEMTEITKQLDEKPENSIRSALWRGDKAAMAYILTDDAGKQLYQKWIKDVQVPYRIGLDNVFNEFRAYVKSSTEAKPTAEQLERLKKAYLNAGIVIRRVSWDQVESEGPCGEGQPEKPPKR